MSLAMSPAWSKARFYAILKMNQALNQLDTRDFGGSGATLKILNASLPFTDHEPALNWDGEWHITIRGIS